MDHGVLLHKLRELGICGRVGVWLASFLNNRFQAVACDGHISAKSLVRSGVPQGTVLGPVLFVILILDIAEGVSGGTRVSSFADDTRASRGIKDTTDHAQLQNDLKQIYNWAERVNMTFNSDKFECLRYWPQKAIGEEFRSQHTYTDDTGNVVEEKDVLKDLGIQMSSDLSFTKHIAKTITSCRKLSGWVLRTFKSRSPDVMLTLWKLMMQSRLDYCFQLWSPYSPGDINKLEDVQRKFTSYIDGTKGLNYRERLKKLKMSSQERRRDRYAVIFIWKVAMGLVDGYQLEFTSSTSRRGRECIVRNVIRNSPTLVQTARLNSLSVKGAKMFNLLPSYIRNVTAEKVDIFKSKLDSFLKMIPDEPTISEEGRAAQSNSLLHQIPMVQARR